MGRFHNYIDPETGQKGLRIFDEPIRSRHARTNHNGSFGNKTTTSGIAYRYEIDGEVTPKELANLAYKVTGEAIAPEDWAEEVKNAYRTLTVRANKLLIGYVRVDMSPDNPEVALAEDAFIRTQYQGRGIFSSMVAMGIEQLKEDGFKEIHFKTSPENEDMYRHLGFAGVGNMFTLNLQPEPQAHIDV